MTFEELLDDYRIAPGTWMEVYDKARDFLSRLEEER